MDEFQERAFMGVILTRTRDKLVEAGFFLALLGRLQKGEPITAEPLDNEATYFTSALLNACYSVGELLKHEGIEALRETSHSVPKDKLKEAVKNLRDQNPDLYLSDRKEGYGLRPLAVHHKPVDVRHRDRTLGMMGSVPFGRLMLGEVRREHHLYVDDPISEGLIQIVPRMTTHIHDLEALVTLWENLID